VAAEDDKVGRIRDGQREACGIGDERADQKVGQRRGAGSAGGGIDRRREHDRRGIVRKQHRHHGADGVNQREQALRRSARECDGDGSESIEQAFHTRELREQHHAGEKEIDVDPAPNPGERVGP
jgi:hypothetical protein